MDMKSAYKKIGELIGRYKFVVIILLVGVVLMLLPSGNDIHNEDTGSKIAVTEKQNLEEELSELLSNIYGAGQVKVMLSQAAGEETIYQTDEDRTNSENSASIRSETVLITDGSRNDSGLVKQTIPAKYLGAIVLCQGADDPAIRLEIANAVSKITGLGLDKIAILKMK